MDSTSARASIPARSYHTHTNTHTHTIHTQTRTHTYHTHTNMHNSQQCKWPCLLPCCFRRPSMTLAFPPLRVPQTTTHAPPLPRRPLSAPPPPPPPPHTLTHTPPLYLSHIQYIYSHCIK